VDLAAVVALARSAPRLAVGAPPLPEPGPAVRVAVAAGAAFTFTYTDTLEALSAAGAEVVTFDPARDRRLPERLAGLVIGGGFPETHVVELAANGPLLAEVRAAVGRGVPTWAECGGLLYLCRTLDGTPMAGVIAADATMTSRLSLGYRQVVTAAASPIGPAGTRFRAHEFHYARIEPGGDSLHLGSRWGDARAGFATASLLASFAHHHPGGDPSLISQFVATGRASTKVAGGGRH
jgi:cobyrinic acid a,c-diamide synthase